MDYWLFTDGSKFPGCKHGGWAFVLLCGAANWLDYGSERALDSNELELVAVIKGLEAIQDTRAQVNVYTDSLFVIGFETRRKMKHYIKWRDRFRALIRRHDVKFIQLTEIRPFEHRTAHHLAREACKPQ